MSNHPLRSFRAKAGLTLEELASLVDVSKASLSRIETGNQTPSLGLVERLISVSAGDLSANDFVRSRDPDETRA